MKHALLFLLLIFLPAIGGCDRIYALLDKPGGEERQILGKVDFNEYNPKVEEVQKNLRLLGYTIGRSDGRFGAASREAVVKFQTDEGLKPTRFVDKATWERLVFYANCPLVKDGKISTRAIQQALAKAGYDPGKIDGQLGARSKSALRRFQKDKGLAADGLVGSKTIRTLLEYFEKF
jgi:peptidoglycan hydrolase-like protein with peptidoglycan-binding domain